MMMIVNDNNDEDRLSHKEKKAYILNIARALEYLHSFNIIHRDVKVNESDEDDSQ